ncbi:MAG: ABC transporter permease, partial [Bacillota bacterium]
PGQISALLIRVKPGVTPQAVARSISQAVPGVKVLVSEGIVSTVRQRLAVPVKNLALSGAVMWLVVFLMTAALLTMMAAERKREFGLLRAMGASRRFLIQLIILEAGILTALGGLFGVIGSGILIYAFKNLLIYTLELPFHWPAWSRLTGLVASILLLSVLAGVLSAAYPAYRYSQLDPYDAIRAGE